MGDRPASYVLVPGAGSGPWYWHLILPLLEARGHDVVTPDLPVEDDAAGLAEYVRVIETVIGDRRHPTLVVQSMGALPASVVATKPTVERLVLVAPIILRPGETGGEWWEWLVRPGSRPGQPVLPSRG